MDIENKLKNIMFLSLILLLCMPAQAQDNEVMIDQAGDNVIIEADQKGYDNVINIDLGIISSDSSNNIFRALQDGFNNEINFSLDGQSNELAILQEGNNQFPICPHELHRHHVANAHTPH